MRSTRLGLLGPGSGQHRLAPESDSRLRVFINSAPHAGFLNERGKEALALSGTLKAGASEFGLMQEALYRRTGGSLPQRHDREAIVSIQPPRRLATRPVATEIGDAGQARPDRRRGLTAERTARLISFSWAPSCLSCAPWRVRWRWEVMAHRTTTAGGVFTQLRSSSSGHRNALSPSVQTCL